MEVARGAVQRVPSHTGTQLLDDRGEPVQAAGELAGGADAQRQAGQAGVVGGVGLVSARAVQVS